MDGNRYITEKTCDTAQLCSLPLAMAYVPWQQWRDIYKADMALVKGTLFAELDLQFKGRGVMGV